jgi:hypothetical protein
VIVLWRKTLSNFTKPAWFQTLHEDLSSTVEQYKTKPELWGHIS